MTSHLRIVEKVEILSLPDRGAMAETAARAIADELRGRLDAQENVRMVFGAAPS
ncbi:MAG: glucosamine-6-phosphate deaminase, partial [Rhodobacteraceae bacterium]|nr:glucosamine-6-phosphate deaminase [Paracoccaceae bacterium]